MQVSYTVRTLMAHCMQVNSTLLLLLLLLLLLYKGYI